MVKDSDGLIKEKGARRQGAIFHTRRVNQRKRRGETEKQRERERAR